MDANPITVEAAVKVADKCGIVLDWIYRENGQGPLEIDLGGSAAAAPVEDPAEDLSADGGGLTIAQTKRQLARSLGVDLSSIKIIIEA